MTKGHAQIEAITPFPDTEEAAAIAASVEQFLRDTSSNGASPGASEHPSPWTLAAILEGVREEISPDLANPWINT